MAYPVAANIITGFLGSGKTTLLKHVLTHGLEKERVAVIMNEVADLGIDGKVIQGMNVDKMIELDSGCICCSGILQLGLAVQEIIEAVEPTVLLIESSGVAEVAPLVGELRGIGLRADAVITLVDAENIMFYCKESEVAEEQIENADFLVLNKTDLVDPRRLDKIEKRLRKLNSRAILFRTQHGAVDTDFLFASSVRRYREAATTDQTHNHLHAVKDGFESFVYKEEGSLDRKLFERFLGKLLPQAIYRSKGIVQFDGESQPSLFNYVCGRYSLDWFAMGKNENFTNQAVFIGRDIERHKHDILKSLRFCHRA